MSGGSFNNSGYIYYHVAQFADELEIQIENNMRENEYGYAPKYPDEVITYLKTQIEKIRSISNVMRAIDYLYSGDHDEDSFLRAVKRLEEELPEGTSS